MEQMPMWCPPTPPTSEGDVYVDHSLGFLYENTPMSEAQLPPVFVKKDLKRQRVDPVISERDGRRPAKIRHKEESVFAPRSLFDRPSPALLKMRRDMKLHKYRGMVRTPVAGVSGLKPPLLKSPVEQENLLEWTIHEDWALLQAIQVYQSLPLNLVVLSPGQTPNWDLVADIVNNTSRIYRSPKQCRSRYEMVIVPREEGKLLYDTAPKKQKKQKGGYKMPQVAEQQSKTNRPMRTSQLYNQDKNFSFTTISCQRHDAIKMVSNKKAPTTKPVCMNPSLKNPKHAGVLVGYGVQYENPLSPMEVAIRRLDRINKEKMKNVPTQDQQQAATRLVQQQLQQQQIQLQQAQPSTSGVSSQVHQVSQPVVTTTTTVALTPIKTNTAIASASGTPVTTTPVKTRPATAIAMQESRSTPTVVSVANISTPPRIAAVNLVSAAQNSTATTPKNIVGVTMTSGGKQITQAQLQFYRQQQLIKQQQILKQQAQAGGVQKVAVSGTAASAAVAQQRAALIRQGVPASGTVQTVGGKQPVAKLSENEIAFLKKQNVAAALQQGKTVTQVQVPTQSGLTPTQLFAQAGLQMQTSTSTSPVALVKAPGMTGVRATPQQIRQLQLHPQLLAQRKLPGQKVTTQLAQVTGKAGVQGQLIFQQKPGTVTVQQFQQVLKGVQPSAVQQFTHVSAGQTVSQAGQVVLSKASIQNRAIPGSSGMKQTIQVVTASSAQSRQSSPSQGKTIVATPRGSPGSSQVRLQSITQATHSQQVQLQQQQQQQHHHHQQQQQHQNQPDSQ